MARAKNWSMSEKAAAVVDLVAGMSLGEVARKHGIPRATIQGWANELKSESGKSDFEIKKDAFLEAYAEFGIATMRMLEAQAQMLSDFEFVRGKPTTDVVKHTEFIRDTFAGFQRKHGAPGADALPERAAGDEAIEPEIVDA